MSKAPHLCLKALDDAGINQYDIGEKVGTSQSSISRIQRKKFANSKWTTVERIQSLYKHVCINKESLDTFPSYEEYAKRQAELESQSLEQGA